MQPSAARWASVCSTSIRRLAQPGKLLFRADRLVMRDSKPHADLDPNDTERRISRYSRSQRT